MSSLPADPQTRGPVWKWWVCGLLLLATMINYMDRLTLNQTVKRVMEEVGFDERDYGELESAFAYAFALGAVLFGWLVDRTRIRWLYPAALFAWSAVGFATGLVDTFSALLLCRFLLGFAEAGHWPCALRTTQHILPPAQRPMGNSILQSGAALGSVLTPLLILALPKGEGTWRYPFMIVGGVGMLWVLGWLGSVRSTDLNIKRPDPSPMPLDVLVFLAALFGVKNGARWVADHAERFEPFIIPDWLPLPVSVAVSVVGMLAVFRWLLRQAGEEGEADRPTFVRRFWVLVVVVVSINSVWHFFRAWLPLFLQNVHEYSEDFTNGFSTWYYVSADIGSLTAGAVALLLSRLLLSVHGSRLAVFGCCAGLVSLGAVVPFLPDSLELFAVLLVVGFAALGLFPCYYSLSQELAPRHQGKVSGALGCCSWLAMAPLQEAAGDIVKRTGSYSLGMAATSFAPLVGLAALVLFWSGNPFNSRRGVTRP